MNAVFGIASCTTLWIAPVASFAHDLRTLPRIEARAPNACPSVAPAGPFAPAGGNYHRKYQTIAHRFLDEEVGAGDVTQDMYAIIDAVIDESLKTLKPYSPAAQTADAQNFALDALMKIDCILLRHGFVYPGHGLVQLLSDGLGPTFYNSEADLAELRDQRHNLRRAAFITARGKGPFYVVDCDEASYIYLAIAEVMKYPVYLVEIPRHNFVRWVFADESYIDFETMDGFKTDDQYYKTNWLIKDAFVGRGGILSTMNEKQTLAYHQAAVAVSWSWRGDTTRMTDFYLRSIATDSTHVFALNNLAWFYAAVPKLELRNGIKAVRYASQAVAIVADGDDLDTLACAYAQSDDFGAAEAKEKEAIDVGYTPFSSDLQSDLALFVAKPPRKCNDLTFGHDPEPFRPGQTSIDVDDDKALLRLH